MSAFELTDALIPAWKGAVDFVCLNFANGDMVGHTKLWAKRNMRQCWQMCRKVITGVLANDYTT
jgi:2,3-bisphosphoglycerate-independent phosphoglycerate mutase